MTDIERLLAIEEIKQLKAKYFYCLDHKEWATWKKEVFAPDASLHVPESRAEPYVGIDNIIAWVSASTGDQVSVHHGHMPEIEVLSDTTARGIWSMEDKLRWPDGKTTLHGYGHYHETYEKVAGKWRIKTLKLTRLRTDRT